VADQAANGAQEQTPESRLYAAGFTRQLEYWRTPDGSAVLNLNDAIAKLDAGEIQPRHLSWPGVHPDAVVGFRAPSEEEIERLFRPPPPPEQPPPMPSWGAPWAALVAELLTPIIRREIRAAVKAEARKQAQEPT
jgi:hypothetical protein